MTMIIAATLLLAGCTPSHPDLMEYFEDIPEVTEDNIAATVDSACGVYSSMSPERVRELGLPPADEMIAAAISDGGSMHPADALYVARMIGLNECPDAATPHLYPEDE